MILIFEFGYVLIKFYLFVNLFLMLLDQELEDFGCDICDNGQFEDVILYWDMIFDGCNCYMVVICKGLVVCILLFEGDDWVVFVWVVFKNFK